MVDHPLCVDYRILGEHLPGTYAEHVAVPARNVARLPPDFAFEAAAAAPLVFMTAWRLLVTRARIRPGEDVLILGAGAGVSTAAIQIAKLAGCTVFVTSSSEAKLEKAKALGADVLINYNEVPWSKAVWELTGKRGGDALSPQEPRRARSWSSTCATCFGASSRSSDRRCPRCANSRRS